MTIKAQVIKFLSSLQAQINTSSSHCDGLQILLATLPIFLCAGPAQLAPPMLLFQSFVSELSLSPMRYEMQYSGDL